MKVWNDLRRQKERLIPLDGKSFKIYVCGPTVYDRFHLGNARPFIVFDTLRRYLLYKGYDVCFVQNFTDIDDKVIRRAQEEGVTVKELADRMIKEYFIDADGLNVMRASHYPRATECMPDIVDMIQSLLDKKAAYVTSDGVYYHVPSFEDYGKLSRFHLEELEAGAGGRTDSHEEKRSPADFALWKFKKEGEPAWPAPWGEGRPGWHIECSAMSKKYLGKTLDIHGGGQDLIFPHHENEIAQSEMANEAPFVNVWMHNGFINVVQNGRSEKMAKSEGNFFMVRDLVQHYPYEVLRFFMLQAHYRMPINFSSELLDAASHGWARIKQAVSDWQFILQQGEEKAADSKASAELMEAQAAAKTHFEKAMDDDMNTADAFAAIFDLVRQGNSLSQKVQHESLKAARDQVVALCEILGLSPAPKEAGIPAEVEALSEERMAAKEARDFAKADALREAIKALGWRVEDTAQGPRLSREER